MMLLICAILLLAAIGLSETALHLGKLMLGSFLLVFLVCSLDKDIHTLADAFRLQFLFIVMIYSFAVAGILQIIYRCSRLIRKRKASF